MKIISPSLLVIIFLTASCFSTAQPQHRDIAQEKKHLMNFYHQWSAAGSENNFTMSSANKKIETSYFYPARATNYNWNTSASAWDFVDTTLYTYTGTLVSTLTRKDDSNSFLSRVLKSYDSSSHLIEAVYQDWLASWVNNYRDTFVFDSYNNLVTHLSQTWNGSAWITSAGNGNNYLLTYSGSGKILVQVAQTWNGAAWDNVSQFTNTYNANDQVTQTIRESWNTVTLVWNNTTKSDYVYDISNVNIQATDYLWNGSAWINNTQIINPVWAVWTGEIATSKPQSYIFQTWSGSAWVNDEQLLSATYDSFGGSVETYQLYISNVWVNENRYSIFYDTQFNNTGERNETWNIPFTVWDTTYEFRYLFSYDMNNSITQSIYQEYDGTAHAYLNYYKTVYSDFLLLNVSSINPSENFSVTIFPNPVTDFSDVTIVSENFNPASFQVFDVNGKRIFSEASKTKNFRLHKNNFTSGIYLLLISGEAGETASVKFMIQ